MEKIKKIGIRIFFLFFSGFVFWLAWFPAVTWLFWRSLPNEPNSFLQLLVTLGADKSAIRNGICPIHWASKKGQIPLVSFLLNNREDPNRRALDGSTPLHFAAEGGGREMVAFLLSNGGNIDLTNDALETPLHVAAFCGRMEVLQEFKKVGWDLERRDHAGLTPFLAACSWQRFDAASFLLQEGSQLKNRSKRGQNPLHLLFSTYQVLHVPENSPGSFTIQNVGKFNDEFTRNLILSGVDVNEKDSNQETPLHLAIRNPYPIEAVKFLIRNGANPKALNKWGKSPVECSFGKRKEDIEKFLQEYESK